MVEMCENCRDSEHNNDYASVVLAIAASVCLHMQAVKINHVTTAPILKISLFASLLLSFCQLSYHYLPVNCSISLFNIGRLTFQAPLIQT